MVHMCKRDFEDNMLHMTCEYHRLEYADFEVGHCVKVRMTLPGICLLAATLDHHGMLLR